MKKPRPTVNLLYNHQKNKQLFVWKLQNKYLLILKRRFPGDKRLRRISNEGLNGIDESVLEELHQRLMGNVDESFSFGSFDSDFSSDEESLNEYPQENNDVIFKSYIFSYFM